MNELELQSVRVNAKIDYLKLNAKTKKDFIKQQFSAAQPNEVWVSDTTCFNIQGKWYYIGL